MREIIFYWYFRKFSDMVTGEVRLFDTSGNFLADYAGMGKINKKQGGIRELVYDGGIFPRFLSPGKVLLLVMQRKRSLRTYVCRAGRSAQRAVDCRHEWRLPVFTEIVFYSVCRRVLKRITGEEGCHGGRCTGGLLSFALRMMGKKTAELPHLLNRPADDESARGYVPCSVVVFAISQVWFSRLASSRGKSVRLLRECAVLPGRRAFLRPGLPGSSCKRDAFRKTRESYLCSVPLMFMFSHSLQSRLSRAVIGGSREFFCC